MVAAPLVEAFKFSQRIDRMLSLTCVSALSHALAFERQLKGERAVLITVVKETLPENPGVKSGDSVVIDLGGNIIIVGYSIAAPRCLDRSFELPGVMYLCGWGLCLIMNWHRSVVKRSAEPPGTD